MTTFNFVKQILLTKLSNKIEELHKLEMKGSLTTDQLTCLRHHKYELQKIYDKTSEGFNEIKELYFNGVFQDAITRSNEYISSLKEELKIK